MDYLYHFISKAMQDVSLKELTHSTHLTESTRQLGAAVTPCNIVAIAVLVTESQLLCLLNVLM